MIKNMIFTAKNGDNEATVKSAVDYWLYADKKGIVQVDTNPLPLLAFMEKRLGVPSRQFTVELA